MIPNNVNISTGLHNDAVNTNKKFPGINFSCQNVCSLNVSKPSKRTHEKLISLTNCGSDIIFISDTRMNSDKQIAGVNNIVKKLGFMGYSLHHNSLKSSRGVAILVSNKLVYTIIDEHRDEACNILFLKMKFAATTITVGSIYGPNTDDLEFFNKLGEIIRQFNSDYVVIGGDWNTTLDSRNSRNNLDILNTASIPSARRSGWLNTLLTECNLIDPFRHFFPDTPEYTYVPYSVVAVNRSRLDFFLISDKLVDQCVNCRIPHSLSSLLFDHKQVHLYFKRNNPYKKQVLNDTILKDFDINQVVNIATMECYINHLVPSDVVSDLQIDELKLIIGQATTMQHEIASCRLNDATLGTDYVNIDRIQELVQALNNTMELLPTLDELQEMDLSCSSDVFLEILIMSVKNSSLSHQQSFFKIKNAKKIGWRRR
jgi:exonuclease III